MMTKLYTREDYETLFNEQKTICVGPGDTWASTQIVVPTDKLAVTAFDYACSVATTSAGNIRIANMTIISENVITGEEIERVIVTGARTWTRVFVPLDHGTWRIRFRTDSKYLSTDKVYLKDFNHHIFRPSPQVVAIDKLKPPVSQAGTQMFDTLESAMRLQRTGNHGSAIEMQLIFDTVSKFNSFYDAHFERYLLVECNYGIYGGYIQAGAEPETEGPLRFLTITLLSPQRAGVGVNGI